MGNPQSLSAQRGEALICRAYNHFVLATTFCKAYGTNADKDLGIPYIKEPETSVNPQYSRGTVAEVYQNIAADLEEGLPLIDDNIYSRVKYHLIKRLPMHLLPAFIYITHSRIFLTARRLSIMPI